MEPSVIELCDDYKGDTFRAVYTVRFEEAIVVLHSFQKKSTHRIATPKHEIDLIHARLKLAEELYKKWKSKGGKSKVSFNHVSSNSALSILDNSIPPSEAVPAFCAQPRRWLGRCVQVLDGIVQRDGGWMGVALDIAGLICTFGGVLVACNSPEFGTISIFVSLGGSLLFCSRHPTATVLDPKRDTA